MSANSIDDIPVGLGTRVTKTVSESNVHLFAGITGDLDPNHVDEEYCRGNARLGRSKSKTSGTPAGVRTLAFTQFLLGPAACQHLADMGADVIKIEPPGRRAHPASTSHGDLRIGASQPSRVPVPDHELRRMSYATSYQDRRIAGGL
jgi:CoA-transferase family III